MQNYFHPPPSIHARTSGEFPSPKQAAEDEEEGNVAFDGAGTGDRQQEADQEGLVQNKGGQAAGADRRRTLQGKDQQQVK